MYSKKRIIITIVLVVVGLTVIGAISLALYYSSQVAPQKSSADTLSCGNSTCDINEQCEWNRTSNRAESCIGGNLDGKVLRQGCTATCQIPNANLKCETPSVNPIIGASISWPITDNTDLQWEWFNTKYEDDTKWRTEIKPKMIADLQKYLTSLGIDSKEKRKVANIAFQIPVYSIQSETRRKAIVTRMFEVSRELDIPISFKLLFSHWWGFDKGPNGSWYSNVDQIWDSNKHSDWYDQVEWWGWSKDYVWANPTSNPSRVDTLWRNWGSLFEIHFPHPNFSSTKYRNLYTTFVGPVFQQIAIENAKLKTDCKEYLFGFVSTDQEVAMGLNWESVRDINGVSTFGVKEYIEKHCPTDVLSCLPAKPSNITKEAWIKQKSDEYWRPDDFYLNNISVVQDYLKFTAKLALDSGLPKEKVITHTVMDYKIKSQKGNNISPFSDAALNEYNNNPGYSVYLNGLSTEGFTRLYNSLKFIKTNRSVPFVNFMEYLDNGDSDKWQSDLATLQGSSFPKIKFINIQNWDSIDPESSSLSGYKAGISIIKSNILSNSNSVSKFTSIVPISSSSSTIMSSQGSNSSKTSISTGTSGTYNIDLNKDGRVDNLDKTLFESEFGQSPKFLPSDLNKDGSVDTLDRNIFERIFGAN